MILAITQARLGSNRFPRKILKTSCYGKTLLQHHIERVKKSQFIDEFCLATTYEEGVDAIIDVARKTNISFYQGSTNDVLDRFYQTVQSQKRRPEYIVRITSDCPLIDPQMIDGVVTAMKKHPCDYVSNTISPTYPDGQDVEIFTYESLVKAWKKARDVYQREHVTPYIYENSNSVFNIEGPEDFSSFRFTFDYPEDFFLIDELLKRGGEDVSWLNCIEIMEKYPKLKKLNAMYARAKSF